MIVFGEKILQLTYQNNHNDMLYLEIIHVVGRMCVAFHHSDLYQVFTHIVGERPTFGWPVNRNWYENHKLLSPS